MECLRFCWGPVSMAWFFLFSYIIILFGIEFSWQKIINIHILALATAKTASCFSFFFLGLQCHGVQPHLVYIFFYLPTNRRNVPHLPCKRFFVLSFLFFLILKELSSPFPNSSMGSCPIAHCTANVSVCSVPRDSDWCKTQSFLSRGNFGTDCGTRAHCTGARCSAAAPSQAAQHAWGHHKHLSVHCGYFVFLFSFSVNHIWRGNAKLVHSGRCLCCIDYLLFFT